MSVGFDKMVSDPLTECLINTLPPTPNDPNSNRSSGSARSHMTFGKKSADGANAGTAAGLSIRTKSSSSSPGQYSQRLPRPPTPPMTKSQQKMLQLTGHDLRFEGRIGLQRSEFLESTPSSSSESAYSQREDGSPWRTLNPELPDLTSSKPAPEDGDLTQLPSNSYNASENSKGEVPSGIGPPSSRPNAGVIQKEPELAGELGRTYSTEPITLKSFIRGTGHGHKQEAGNQQRTSMTNPNFAHLVPAPLSPTKGAKSPTLKAAEPRRSSLLANARESMAWGIRELQGASPINKNKDPVIPENVVISPTSPLGQTRKRKGRLSGAMRRLSGAKASPEGFSSPTRTTTVISNKERAPGGPDTPVVPKTGFFPSIDLSEAAHHGNEHFQEVYERAKKSLRIKTSDERRRESLKKKIVVVGITDQSPDGRVAEWL